MKSIGNLEFVYIGVSMEKSKKSTKLVRPKKPLKPQKPLKPESEQILRIDNIVFNFLESHKNYDSFEIKTILLKDIIENFNADNLIVEIEKKYNYSHEITLYYKKSFEELLEKYNNDCIVYDQAAAIYKNDIAIYNEKLKEYNSSVKDETDSKKLKILNQKAFDLRKKLKELDKIEKQIHDITFE